MSKTTKKRFIIKQIEMEFVLPDAGELIALVTASRGSYLLEVNDEKGDTYLVSMPAKFRNTIWVKRGNFVILEPIEEGHKVRAEIRHVLDTENILYIRQKNRWPLRFECNAEAMTRHAKRGVDKNIDIDPKMLPPTDSEDECYENDDNPYLINS